MGDFYQLAFSVVSQWPGPKGAGLKRSDCTGPCLTVLGLVWLKNGGKTRLKVWCYYTSKNKLVDLSLAKNDLAITKDCFFTGSSIKSNWKVDLFSSSAVSKFGYGYNSLQCLMSCLHTDKNNYSLPQEYMAVLAVSKPKESNNLVNLWIKCSWRVFHFLSKWLGWTRKTWMSRHGKRIINVPTAVPFDEKQVKQMKRAKLGNEQCERKKHYCPTCTQTVKQVYITFSSVKKLDWAGSFSSKLTTTVLIYLVLFTGKYTAVVC